jgi:vacuolar protein sorting-associated protein 13A/C
MRLADCSSFVQHPELHQHIFELDFKVDTLRASISKSGTDGVDKPLGDLDLEGFALSFALAKYNMTVDINLRYFFLFQRRLIESD